MNQEYWEKYVNIMTADGDTRRERQIHKTKHMLSPRIESSPSCKDVMIDDVERKLLILSTDLPNKKTAYALPNEHLSIGSIVLWNKSHWLITEVDKDDDVLTRASIEMCNRKITWQNEKTGEILSRWATVQKPHYANLSRSQVITTSSREFKVQMPYDAESSLIDIDKRFMLEKIGNEPKTYVCTSVDSITERYDCNEGVQGFLVLNLTQDQYNPKTDNAELNICNYISPVTPDPHTPSSINYKILFNGEPEIKIGGSGKKFRYECRDADNNLIASPSAIAWNFADPTAKIKNVINGEDLILSAPNDNSLIGSSVRISIMDSSDELKYVIVKVVSLFG